MIQLITGKKGTGKTKILVDMINAESKNTKGNIVCIEKGAKLTYDIDHSVRLTNTEDYTIEGFDTFYGFLAGMFAGNFDISEVFIDGIFRIAGRDYDKLGVLLQKLNKLSGNDIKIVFTVSADLSELPESVQAFV